jgi:hypothetical protein
MVSIRCKNGSTEFELHIPDKITCATDNIIEAKEMVLKLIETKIDEYISDKFKVVD